MAGTADLMAWFVDESGSIAGLDTAANAQYYYSGVGMMPNWMHQCMVFIIEEYFRGDTEDGICEIWNSHTIAQGGVNMPSVGIKNEGFLDSLMLASELLMDSSAPTEDAYFGTLDPLDAQRRIYDWLWLMGFRELTFDEWLHMQGIMVSKVQETFTVEAKFELLCQHRQFVMPSNAIDTSDGSAASALVFKKDFTGDKDYLFKVPGFIVGVMFARMKTYLGRQYSAGVNAIISPNDFLPKIEEFRAEDAWALGMDLSAGNVNTTGIFSTGTADATSPSGAYIHDLMDLFFQGDQFVNDFTNVPGVVVLLTIGLQIRYLVFADVNDFFAALFIDLDRFIFQDGRVDFTIMSDLRDNRFLVASQAG